MNLGANTKKKGYRFFMFMWHAFMSSNQWSQKYPPEIQPLSFSRYCVSAYELATLMKETHQLRHKRTQAHLPLTTTTFTTKSRALFSHQSISLMSSAMCTQSLFFSVLNWTPPKWRFSNFMRATVAIESNLEYLVFQWQIGTIFFLLLNCASQFELFVRFANDNARILFFHRIDFSRRYPDWFGLLFGLAENPNFRWYRVWRSLKSVKLQFHSEFCVPIIIF